MKLFDGFVRFCRLVVSQELKAKIRKTKQTAAAAAEKQLQRPNLILNTAINVGPGCHNGASIKQTNKQGCSSPVLKSNKNAAAAAAAAEQEGKKWIR